MEKSLSPLFDGISPESRAAMKTCFDVREQRFRADEVIYDFAARRDIIGILAEGRLRTVGTAGELMAQAGASSFEDAFVALAGEKGAAL